MVQNCDHIGWLTPLTPLPPYMCTQHAYTHIPCSSPLARKSAQTSWALKDAEKQLPPETSSLSEERKADHTSARAPALWEGMSEVGERQSVIPAQVLPPRALDQGPRHCILACIKFTEDFHDWDMVGTGAHYCSWWAPPAGLMATAVMWASTPCRSAPRLRELQPSLSPWLAVELKTAFCFLQATCSLQKAQANFEP